MSISVSVSFPAVSYILKARLPLSFTKTVSRITFSALQVTSGFISQSFVYPDRVIQLIADFYKLAFYWLFLVGINCVGKTVLASVSSFVRTYCTSQAVKTD